jgi:hypothetical protein
VAWRISAEEAARQSKCRQQCGDQADEPERREPLAKATQRHLRRHGLVGVGETQGMEEARRIGVVLN